MLTLVETAEGVRRAAAAGDTGRLIALSPEAEYEAARLGLKYHTQDDYEPDQERSALGQDNFTRAEVLCVELDRCLASLCSGLVPTDFRPALAGFFWFKVLCDVVTVTSRTVDRIAQAEGDRAIRLWTARSTSRIPPDLNFLGESVYSRIVPLIASARGLRYEEMNAGRWVLSGPPGLWGRVPILMAAAKWLYRLSASSRLKLRPGLPRAYSEPVGTAIVLAESLFQPLLDHSGLDVVSVTTFPWNRTQWLRRSHGRGRQHNERIRNRRALPGALRGAWEDLRRSAVLQELFIVEGRETFPVVADRLQYWITNVVPWLVGVFRNAKSLAASVPHPVVTSIEMFDQGCRAVAQAAHAVGAPVVTYQHGGAGFWHYPVLEWTDLASSDWYLTWGAGVDEFIRREHPDTRSRTAVVGSVLVDRSVMRLQDTGVTRKDLCRPLALDPGRPIVVYLLGNLTGNQRYFSGQSCSDSRFWLTQRSIVGVLAEFPDVQAVIKLHPNRAMPASPIAKWIRDAGATNCRVVRDLSFEELLPVADLFVIDAPATAILQMLAARRRILVFNDFYRFDPSALELLKRSVVFSSKLEEFLPLLREHLRERRFDALPADDGAFLARYGLPHRDGLSAERLARAIEAVSRGATVESAC